jgi:hypothetical protein
MLSMQNIESELSYAYLHAIASRAGIICEYAGRHSDAAGVDAVLRVKGRLATDSSLTQFTVDVQLKATKKAPVEQAGRYSHSLEVKNYDALRSTDAGAPQLLVVLFLPDDAETWLTHGVKGLSRGAARIGSACTARPARSGTQRPFTFPGPTCCPSPTCGN